VFFRKKNIFTQYTVRHCRCYLRYKILHRTVL